MKKTLLVLAIMFLVGTATAQVDRDAYNKQRQQMREQFNREQNEARQQYDNERRKAEAEYAEFRKKANEEYAAAVRQAWQQMGIQPAEPKPEEPKPPTPRKPAPDKLPTTINLPQGETVPRLLPPPPAPLPPIPEPAPEVPTMQFLFYGIPCIVHANVSELRFRLASLNEKDISDTWKMLSHEKYDGLLHDCLAQREALNLPDWGYMQLLGNMSEQLLGNGSNEAVLLQMYLLAQSGYRVRLARAEDRLVLLMPFNRNIYNHSFIYIDSIRYFVMTTKKPGSVKVCNVSFPGEQVANILMSRMPSLYGDSKRSRTVASRRYGRMKATVSVDECLINFLGDYPLSSAWEYYSLAGLSDEVKSTLYPALRSQIGGISKKEAAEMLLNFVQTGFEYATDQDQFGYERPLFGDESFYYPKNDCEDRSILYCILVRDLLGLDVVLVHWPGHLGTAVAFPDEVPGDYFNVDGRRFTVCDPTYIGAGVGETMPQFKDVEAKLVRL